jgi:hypothetical protein
MIKDKSLASIIPYGHILDDGTVYLRGRGWMIGFEFHGLPWESSTQAQLESASERMTEAMRHLGTNDMVQAIFHRLPSVHYPQRDFPSEAARLIDEERRSQFESEHYWQTRSRLYVTTEIESVARSGLRSAVFGTDGWRPHVDLTLQRLRERVQKFQDSLGGTIELRRLPPEETFRDLILNVTGKDYPAILPTGYVRLNEVYQWEDRQLAVGDRLQFRTPDKARNIANGEFATITEIDPGHAKLHFDNNRELELPLAKLRHVDHGYAVTSHSSQGATVDRVIANVDSMRSAKLVNQPQVYVSISRARHDAQVFTNDLQTLERAVGRRPSKKVAMEVVKPAAPTQSLKPQRETTELKPQQTTSFGYRP